MKMSANNGQKDKESKLKLSVKREEQKIDKDFKSRIEPGEK